MHAKTVKPGLRVELCNPTVYGRGVWHVLDRAPGGTSSWWLHRWHDVPVFNGIGYIECYRREWQTVEVTPSGIRHAYTGCHPGDLMDYPQAETLEDVAA